MGDTGTQNPQADTEQAETVYDPEAGVTYGTYFAIQQSVEDEWQDRDTITEDYGFTSIGYPLACGEEVSFFCKWDWLYGTLPPGECRFSMPVYRKENGNAPAETYLEDIRFRVE